ncbi:MAG: helix-turn-helix domain-containing protein [Chitinivibrionales bacterium]|nr:helix-turn-helix domain-containing protein [Chitinivibrionales bacterium]
MAETVDSNETQQVKAAVPAEQKVGDTLHKERVTRRITLETMSKDLKINAKYIRAIESNNYQELPAAPYVRVYIRSIASYLMLDPEDILKNFYQERGIVEEGQSSENSATEKVTISMKNNEIDKKSISWIAIGVVALLVIIGGIIANQFGLVSKVGTKPAAQNAASDKTDHTKMDADSLSGERQTLQNSAIAQSGSSTGQHAATSTERSDDFGFRRDSSAGSSDSLKLIINTLKDSTWIHVYSDGVVWKNYLRAGNSKVFFARDSITVYIENNSGVIYALNDEELKISGTGEKIFRVDRNGLEFLKLAQWRAVFKKNPK